MSGILHLAIPAGDLNTTLKFYTDILGCTLGNREEGGSKARNMSKKPSSSPIPIIMFWKLKP